MLWVAFNAYKKMATHFRGQWFLPLRPKTLHPGFIYEYLSTFYPSDHDVMQHTQRVKERLSWHGINFPFTLFFVNLLSYQHFQ
jgi:hypothetical protein